MPASDRLYFQIERTSCPILSQALGLEQIRDGLAWHYKKYQFEHKQKRTREVEAKVSSEFTLVDALIEMEENLKDEK